MRIRLAKFCVLEMSTKKVKNINSLKIQDITVYISTVLKILRKEEEKKKKIRTEGV